MNAANATLVGSAPKRPRAVSLGRLLERPVAWFGAILCLAALQFALIFTHQPWLDEWQALQIALQSPTLADLMENLRYEGHPPLWYLILRAVGQLVPPYWVLPVTLAPIAAATMATILFASPFKRWKKLCLVASELVLFEYSTISRSLSLGVCLLVVAMAFRRSRWSWLAVALLPMCDFLFGILSAAVVAIQWKERRVYAPGVALWLGAAAVAAWSVVPVTDAAPALGPGSALGEAYHWLTRLGLLLFPFPVGGNSVPQWSADVPFGLGLLLGPLFLLFAFLEVRRDRLNFAILGGFAVFTLFFSMFIYPLHVRHLSLIALLLILLKWREVDSGGSTSRRFSGWIVLSAACGLAVAAINFVRPFDTAHLAAKEISRLGLLDGHWIAWPNARAQGVSALTGIEFERAGAGCVQSFARWDRQGGVQPQNLAKFLEASRRSYGRFYLLTDRRLDIPAQLAILVSHIPAGYEGQQYALYVVGAELPERPVELPRCAPTRRLPLVAAPRLRELYEG